jgi:hypothetical protein
MLAEQAEAMVADWLPMTSVLLTGPPRCTGH